MIKQMIDMECWHSPSCVQDVAAIQQDIPRPLDFNRELTTVGEWVRSAFEEGADCCW